MDRIFDAAGCGHGAPRLCTSLLSRPVRVARLAHGSNSSRSSPSCGNTTPSLPRPTPLAAFHTRGRKTEVSRKYSPTRRARCFDRRALLGARDSMKATALRSPATRSSVFVVNAGEIFTPQWILRHSTPSSPAPPPPMPPDSMAGAAD